MSPDLDRRAFLTSAPRWLWTGMMTLVNEVTAFARPVADRQEPTTRRKVALLDVSRCLAWDAVDCQLCYLQCPKRDQAIVLEGGRPVVVASACDGCAVCVDVCRSINDLGALELVHASPHRPRNDDS